MTTVSRFLVEYMILIIFVEPMINYIYPMEVLVWS